jgi:hypothetical protein
MGKIRNELKDLKQFGSTLAAILFVFGAVNLMKGRVAWYAWLFGLSLTALLAVIINPKWIRPVYSVFVKFAHVMGWVNTRIILVAIYYLILTPISIVMRIFHADPLHLKILKDSNSYWVKKDVCKASKAGLEKQF